MLDILKLNNLRLIVQFLDNSDQKSIKKLEPALSSCHQRSLNQHSVLATREMDPALSSCMPPKKLEPIAQFMPLKKLEPALSSCHQKSLNQHSVLATNEA